MSEPVTAKPTVAVSTAAVAVAPSVAPVAKPRKYVLKLVGSKLLQAINSGAFIEVVEVQ
jgi:hypothetical protein